MKPPKAPEPPTKTPPAPDLDDEDDGDIATPKRDRDYEAEAFEKRDTEQK